MEFANAVAVAVKDIIVNGKHIVSKPSMKTTSTAKTKTTTV